MNRYRWIRYGRHPVVRASLDRHGWFFFVLFSLLRFAVNIGILERPLVQGLVWGALTGNMTLALSVSIIFELFWLDLVPAGTFIPPNTAAANLAALSLIHFFGFQRPEEIIFPVLLCLPLAWFGSRLEHLQRNRQNAGYNLVLNWTKKARFREFAPQKIILRGIFQSAVMNMIFFCGSVLCLIVLTGVLQSHGFLSPPGDFFSWGHLWLVASLGGILSLRILKAYFVLACGVGLVALAVVF